MPKGRQCVPAAVNDGVWFKHRGITHVDAPQRCCHTTTGVMLTAPYNPKSASYPPAPPKAYLDKNVRNFKLSNNFSAHDNRNSFQDHGVYFGDGKTTRQLGKEVTQPDLRQHYTDNNFWKHFGRETVHYDYNTVYSSSFHGRPNTEASHRRRFPHLHKEGKPGLSKLDTSTTSWFQKPDVPHKTPTHVLAISQEPFLPDNTWKYSYHGISKCYPPYDRVDPEKPLPVWMVNGSKAV